MTTMQNAETNNDQINDRKDEATAAATFSSFSIVSTVSVVHLSLSQSTTPQRQ